MTRSDLFATWQRRAEEWGRVAAQVDGAKVVGQFLADLDSVFRQDEDDMLTLAEAADYSGYSADHLGRMIRDGTVENLGRLHRPRVRRGALPRKPHALRAEAPSPSISDSSKRQIARSVVNSTEGRHDG